MMVNDCQKFYIKAVGVTFEGRQRIIRRLNEGDELQFVPEPENTFDKNRTAVAIKTLSGESVGYVSKDYNSKIFMNITRNRGKYKLFISEITGGGIGSNYGVNIEVNYYPNLSDSAPINLSNFNKKEIINQPKKHYRTLEDAYMDALAKENAEIEAHIIEMAELQQDLIDTALAEENARYEAFAYDMQCELDAYDARINGHFEY